MMKTLSKRHVPEDLWLEILSRHPVKSLLRFRSVCNSWRALIDDPDFARLHLICFNNRNIEQSHILSVEESSKVRCVVKSRTTLDTITGLGKLDSHFEESDILSSIDGLLLLYRRETTRLMLYNPSIRKTLILPPLPTKVCGTSVNFNFGLGFDPRIRDYKAVGFVLKNDLGGVQSVAIYTVGTNSWKLVGFQGEGCSTWRQCFITNNPGGQRSVCLNGILYDVACDTHEYLWKLVSFDLSSELFASSALPAEISCRLVRLMTVDNSLAIFHLGYQGRTLWILEKSSIWTPRYKLHYAFGPVFLPWLSTKDVGVVYFEDGEFLVSGSNGLITINQQAYKEKKEVREMECIRLLLLRCGELLFLLQLLCQHHVTRLIQGLDPSLQQDLLQMTFHQLVCSEEGDRMATRLISGLMEHYTGPDGGETVNDISRRLREGCPSYYKESDQTFYSAVEYLDRAAVSSNSEERDSLARKAFNLLSSVPDSADLHSVCKRFEDLRFYDAVVHLPLQKAQALDPAGDAVNEQMHLGFREHAISLREQLYEIVTTALSNLKGGSSRLSTGVTPIMDPAARKKHICQIVQLAVQWPDRLFHEYLYYSMMNLGLEDELLRYGGTDLVSFLQSAACEPTEEVVPTRMALVSSFSRSSLQTPSKQAKYLDLLARYYVMKRQNLHAAHVLLKLAESRPLEGRDFPSLEQRCQYLSNAVLQAKNARDNDDGVSSARDIGDDGLLDLLEGKLAVVRFQIKIKEELENIALKFETPASTSDSVQNKGISGGWEANQAASCEEKVEELSSDLKSITELYNEYAVPFELWEICLELLYFANYSGDTDNCTMRETWARLIDQAVSKGGVVEACSVLKRIGSRIYPGDGLVLPLEILCLHLEKATLERLNSGQEYIGEEDVPRSLLSVCRGSAEPVLNTYEQLLSTGTVLTSPVLRVRLIRSVLVVLREWALSVYAQRTGTGAVGASLMLTGSGTFSMDVEQAAFDNPGFGDRITSAVNRYMNEVKRLPLPESEKNALYRGFCDIEKSISRPSCGKHT